MKNQKRTGDDIIKEALRIMQRRMSYKTMGDPFESVQQAKDYIRLKLAEREHEVFACFFLDTKHRLIKYVEMFNGTIDKASVFPREVVKEALRLNSSAVIFAHNHPSGMPDPSQSDIHLTRHLTDALALVDVRVLDHIIVGGYDVSSLAELGHM